MQTIKKLVTTTAIIIGIATLTSCSANVDASTYESIIDVRTQEEWNTGHLEGAVLVSVESPDFDAKIQELDKTADYYIYCRSGNRAGIAIERMNSLGFTGELVNGGAVADASGQLGLPVIVD
jgi:phage shock protein E